MTRKHLTAAAIFLVLTLLFTNPLALSIWNAVEDKQDALLNTWILAWVGHALITAPLNLFNANIFYPYPNTLAFSEVLLPPSLLALPLTLAFNNPIFAYNVALMAMLWLNAFGMYLFVYDLTRRTEAALIAGLVYAFNPFNLGNFAQLQLVSLGWLPLALLFLRHLLFLPPSPEAMGAPSKPRWFDGAAQRDGLLFALFFILQALSSFYYALLAAFAVALFFLYWLVTRWRSLLQTLPRVTLPLIVSGILIAVALVPFLLPYFQVQRDLGFQRSVQESEPFSAYLKQFTEVSPQNLVYGSFLAPNPVVNVGGYPQDNLFPGIVAFALALAGLVLYKGTREKWFLLALLAVAFVLALGPRLYLNHAQPTDLVLPYRYLYDVFSPLRALRAPVRFDVLINFALAALAGLGAVALLERVTFARGSWLAAALAGLIALEYLAVPAAGTVPIAVASGIPAVYQWLAQQPPGVTLQLPMMGPDANNALDISNQYFTTYNWQKTPDGYSGFVPPRRGEIAYELRDPQLDARDVALLQALDVNYLIVPSTWNQGGNQFPPQISRVQNFGDVDVYRVAAGTHPMPHFDKHLYVPSGVAAGAPFNAYLVMANALPAPYAVKPTDMAQVQVHWSDGRVEPVSFPIPLVTSSVSVVPIPMTAPARAGDFQLRVQAIDPVIGRTDAGAFVKVGDELAHEVVIPASVKLNQSLLASYRSGDSIPVSLTWLPYNKIDAYFSVSVRLVNENGDKVSNTDRQPAVPTLLWSPDQPVPDTFALTVPPDTPPGTYHVQVLMYQPETDTDVLLLDAMNKPQLITDLGQVEIK